MANKLTPITASLVEELGLESRGFSSGGMSDLRCELEYMQALDLMAEEIQRQIRQSTSLVHKALQG